MDMLYITTYDNYMNKIDTKSGYVSTLLPRQFSKFNIIPTSGQSNFKVNLWTGLNFTFTLPDTTSN